VAAAPAPVAPAVARAADSQATVVVQLPADARMWVDGKLADLSSASRSFRTPALEMDRDYYYTIRAETRANGQTLAQTARVIVRAGQMSRVDFGDLTGVARVTTEGPAPAHVTVRLPADARLFVDDVLAPQTSFDTPKLAAGRTFYYTLRVEPRDGGRSDSRRVELQAGKQVEVDFTAATVASR
jgi:uncharacterized protein (TIGR03000 family)